MNNFKNNRWLSVIGIGEDGLAGLSSTAIRLLETAEFIIGGQRQLEMIPNSKKKKIAKQDCQVRSARRWFQ